MPDSCPMCGTQLAEGSRFCHKCGVPLSSTAPRRQAGSPGPITRLLVVATYLFYLVAWLSCWKSAEAAAVLGLFSVGASLVLITLAIVNRHRWGWCLGAAHCGLYVLLMGLVVIGSLGPRDAIIPFLSIGGIYLVGAIPLSVLAWRQGLKKHHPMTCVNCGYLLYGLTEARCPECGTPFDAKLLATANRTDQG